MSTVWGLAAIGLLVALALSCAAALRGTRVDRLIGLELTGVVAVLFFVAQGQAVGRPALLDLAVAGAALAFGAALVFARFLERWL